MKTRVVIFDENEALRSTLKKILEERGYEVFTFSKSGICPLFHSVDHKRTSDNACSDIIITDLYMPTIEGLKLIKDLIDKGCKVKHRALMSTTWSYADWQYVQKLGCRLFRKPFELKEMLEWVDDCAEKINPGRKLSDLLKKASLNIRNQIA
jgi:DNA-binding NtrC family response regulator